MKPKIAFVNVFFPPHAIGGATRVLVDNIEVLRNKYGEKYEIVIFTTDEDHIQPHSLSVYLYKGIRVYQVGALWREHMDWFPKDKAIDKLFGQFLEFEKPDLVHFHCIQRLGAGISQETLSRNIPYVVTVHDAWWISDFQFLVDEDGKIFPEGHPDTPKGYPDTSFNYKLPRGITKAQSLSRKLYLKNVLKKAKKVFVVSDKFTEIYKKNNVLNVASNPNGIRGDIYLERYNYDDDKVRIGHIGGMARHKGYFLLKKVITQQDYSHIEIITVDHSKSYGFKEEEYWGTTCVKKIGKYPQDLTRELYSQIDILAAISLWPESFGLVSREAVAAGIWVIASNMGAIGDAVNTGENGWVIEPTEDLLIQVLNDIEANYFRYSTRHHARQVESSEAQVDRYVLFYDSIFQEIKQTPELVKF